MTKLRRTRGKKKNMKNGWQMPQQDRRNLTILSKLAEKDQTFLIISTHLKLCIQIISRDTKMTCKQSLMNIVRNTMMQRLSTMNLEHKPLN